MKIVGFTIVTDPDYRQDPWREAIRQALRVFDEVVVVYGKKSDLELIAGAFSEDIQLDRLHPSYLHWPQPEWAYEELPRHLNEALRIARDERGADWAVKFDSDMLFHESQKALIRQKFEEALIQKAPICTFQKYQFFNPFKGYEKGRMPIALNVRSTGNGIFYGVEMKDGVLVHGDLCQPLTNLAGVYKKTTSGYEVPVGEKVDHKKWARSGVHVWNYDYTFKEFDRSLELLYHFDRAHAKFWGVGYTGKKLSEITTETAMQDFTLMTTSRLKKCIKDFKVEDHPAAIQQKIRELSKHQFGFSLWQ